MIRKTKENASSLYEKPGNVLRCSQCTLRRRCTHGDSPSTHSIYSAPTTSSFQTVSIRSTLYTLVILSCVSICLGATVLKDECNPNDPSSCSFGATCQKTVRRRTAYYQCVCPRINCYSGGLYDPICVNDGRTERVHVNALCFMLEQCLHQKPLRVVCNGVCDAKCRESSKVDIPHEHCPLKDYGLCQNGGFCVHHRQMNVSSCRCPEQYGGDRCEMKELTSKSDEGGKDDCNKRFEVLTIFAIALLAVVLLIIMICLCLRSRKSHDKLWNRCEKDETTPLKEDARSESIFPTKLGTKNANGK